MEQQHKLPEEKFKAIADYLAGESSFEETSRLEEWLEEKQENKIFFEKVKRIWQASEVPVEQFQPDASKAWEKIKPQSAYRKVVPIHQSEVEIKADKKNYRWYYAVAASISIIFLFGVAFLFTSDRHLITKLAMQVEKAGSNEIGEILLPDGSYVWVNSNSRLYYPKNFEDSREVYLEGEAFFEVQKDAQKPFIVHSENGIVKVLGTAFNIHDNKKDGLIVHVTEGKVALYSETNESGKAILLKGEKGVLKDSNIEKTQTDNPNFLAWKTGILRFDNEPLSSVTEILSKHYQTRITIKTSGQNCKLTSTFNNKTLDEVLEVIELTMNVKIKKVNDGVIIEDLGCH